MLVRGENHNVPDFDHLRFDHPPEVTPDDLAGTRLEFKRHERFLCGLIRRDVDQKPGILAATTRFGSNQGMPVVRMPLTGAAV